MRRATWHVAVVIAGLAVTACGDDQDKLAACRSLGETTRSTTSAVEVQDRKIIGVASEYPADLSLSARDQELAKSMAARRAVAWQIAERVLAPIPVASPELADRFGSPTVPRFATWYNRDDFERIFKHEYEAIGGARRLVRAPFTSAEINDGLEWNARAVEELASWPEQRYLDYLAAIEDQADIDGLAGARRVAYSPGALRHFLASYSQALACRINGVPAPFVDDVMSEARDVAVTENALLAPCELRIVGPFQAAAATKITASLRAKAGSTGDADLYLRRGAPPTLDDYDCRSDQEGFQDTCTVDGGGPVYVGLLGIGSEAVDVSVDVAYRQVDSRQPACLAGPFPADAVEIKASWSREELAPIVPTFDTSAAAMGARLDPGGTASWGEGLPEVMPSDDQIYTVALPSGGRFRLTGLHIMTKELDHWIWITLWWSPTPNTDFGADRPASFAGIPGPWANYKMSVTTGYVEEDPDPTGGAIGSLGDSLAASHGGLGAPTFTSNPFIELGPGNAATNCIGCHQHGGTEFTAEEIIGDEARFPHHGRTRLRNNFATDYSWALLGGRGDELAAIIQNEADYWDTAD